MGAAKAKRWDRRLLGVISRRAVIEGSAPRKEERDEYDTVAYTGIVPVRVRRRGASCDCSTFGPVRDPTASCSFPSDSASVAQETGDTLVPSGQNDGTAVIAEPGSREHARSRVATVLEACEWSADGNVQLVPVRGSCPRRAWPLLRRGCSTES